MDILPYVRPGDELAATRIYAAALFQKLRPFFGTIEAAASFLAPHMRRDRGVSAILGGRVVGIAGYRLDGTGLFEPKWRHFRQRFGFFGTSIRVAGLAFLDKTDADGVLSMDGIAVSEEARGKGAGTALLGAVVDVARRTGQHAVRLDVIDTNPRARALYERNGFVPEKRRELGFLKPIFGFSSATTMCRQVDAGSGPA
ncbi:GNAT family N-acetyltransferase [Stappia sp. MMSF_3263]|uniref:GNAT family N-acetyltransferase n=1 Tax=Stappia sp. MMSF_3263 TaxID=3046693 RepID=UPI00273E1D13|nr:GNAT family N-acetyltransferase [Stappia sp. MMSF_3263]